MLFVLSAPSGMQQYYTSHGTQYTVSSAGTISVPLSDLHDALGAGFLPYTAPLPVPLTQALGGTGQTSFVGLTPGSLNVQNSAYGAKGDGKALTDCTTTNGQPTVSSASYTFQASDVGKVIAIRNSIGTAVLSTTILSVSAGVATMAANANMSLAANGTCTFGTDDTAAINAAVTSANTMGRGVLYLPTGIYMVTASITWKTNLSLTGDGPGKSILKWASASDMTSGVIQGTSGTKDTQYTDCQFANFEIDCLQATQATYNVAGKGLYIQYMTRPVVQNLYIHDTPASGIGIDFLRYGNISNNLVVNAGRLNGGSGLGGAGIGIAMGNMLPAPSYPEASNVENNIVINAKRYGIFLESVGGIDQTCPVRCVGNYVHLSSTSGYGIGDCGLTNFVCVGNTINGNSGCLDGIVINKGTTGNPPGAQGLIANNVIDGEGSTGCANGITIDYTSEPSGTTISEYKVTGNVVRNCVSAGLNLISNASTSFDTLHITDNLISGSGTAGAVLTGAGGFNDVTISGNLIKNNALTTATTKLKAGVSIQSAITRLRMTGNDIFDNQGTQTQAYAVIVDTVAVTAANIKSNDFSNNLTGTISLTNGGTIAGEIVRNKGYNPVGTSSLSPGASPWTYTAGTSPEVLYVSGGTVSAIAKGGQTLGLTSGTFCLNPNDSITVTYSVTPTVKKDIG